MLGTTVLFLGGVDGGEKKTDKGDAKEVTLKGTVTCGKCDLKKDKACATVIVVKKDNKDVVYYFDPASHKEHHAKVCTEAMPGTVVGTVSEKNGKKMVTVSKLTID
jgi:hypothetical protein